MTYLNAVDAGHRSELRDANDAHWARMETRFDRFEALIDKRLAELEAKLLKWMFLFWVGTIGTVIALQKL